MQYTKYTGDIAQHRQLDPLELLAELSQRIPNIRLRRGYCETGMGAVC
ncbi:MAG: hypothetical protein KDD53_01860 [Bdellovibrionales bacterium]|nr:hypothetical protein [Bdellovibrionales bacterium]